MHNATKVLLGAVRSSFKIVDNKVGTIAAGLIARQKSDGTISIASADGLPLGISIGKDLSDAGRMNICRAGLQVPVLLIGMPLVQEVYHWAQVLILIHLL